MEIGREKRMPDVNRMKREEASCGCRGKGPVDAGTHPHHFQPGKTIRKEELLETIWRARENGDTSIEKVERQCVCPNFKRCLKELLEQNLVIEREGRLELTEAGDKAARSVIRRHRLAEVLLDTVLEVPPELQHSSACSWEHMLSEEVTDVICTFLGHPRSCPHGKAIPEGKCCKARETSIEPIVFPLSEAQCGIPLKIAFIETKSHAKVERLVGFGLVPGRRIVLHRKFPAFIVKLEEREIAFDLETASHIHVRKADPGETCPGA